MVGWVIGSILHGGTIVLFLVPAKLSCLWVGAYKRTLAANHVANVVVAAGFCSDYLSDPLLYISHITINKMCYVCH